MKKERQIIDNLSSFSREEALLIFRFISHYPKKFKYFRTDLANQLVPYYEYEIKCTECSRRFKIERIAPLSEEALAKGGVCVSCSDDFK